ncbi:MAG: hypothetical protein ACREIC_26990 [Limisphaerales bacterium]
MSNLPDNEFDLEKLFLPAWAQEAPSSSKYAKYEGTEERSDRRGDRRGPRPPRRDEPPSGGRPFSRPPGGERRGQQSGPGRPGFSAAGERGGPGYRGSREGMHDDRRGPHRDGPRPRREPPAPLPELDVALIPDEKGVESLARQIKMSGRAYPLFDIAQMILQKPERHGFAFTVKKNPEGQPIQPLFLCALDETLWLSENEAVAHVLKQHFNTFYQSERTATEPPKGKYTFVAQCGMSGHILGPPNHHDYQNQLRKLHAERFSRMPFEVYKSRVKIVKDEAVVKKWVDDQSWKTEYICLNMPEPLRLANMEAVEKHFRENHKDIIIKPVESHRVTGLAAKAFRSAELSRLARVVWEDQRRFPLQIATSLSQQFAGHGLQFFKVDRTITHVAVARPHYLDLSVIPVSDGVKRIVEFISATAKRTRRQLIETLAPSPAPPTTLAVAPEAAAPVAEPSGPTPEQTAVNADLHWLIHQGHVIEFANGVLENAKKPVPKPPKAEPKPVAKPTGVEGAPAPTPSDAVTSGTAETVPAEPGTAQSAESVSTPEQTLPEQALSAPEPKAVEEPPAQATTSGSPSSEPTLPVASTPVSGEPVRLPPVAGASEPAAVEPPVAAVGSPS